MTPYTTIPSLTPMRFHRLPHCDRRSLPSLAIALAIAVGAISTAPAQSVWYVTSTAVGAPGGGTSWANPTSLGNAIALAAANDEIRVKEGVYVPSTAGLGDPRTGTYLLTRGITMRGGFRGTETNGVPAGSAVNTVLSGEIGPSSSNADNLYHVVTINAPATAKVRIERFKVERGKASDTNGQPFPAGDARGRGAGIHIAAGSVAFLSDLYVYDNSSTGLGAGIFSESATVTMRQMTFQYNVAYNGGSGGAIYASRSDLRMANVLFDTNGNNTVSGGGIHLKDGVTKAANCAFFWNGADNGSGGAVFATGTNQSTFWNSTFSGNYAQASNTAAWTIDTAQLTTGSCRLNNCIVFSTGCNTPGQGGSTHFRMGGSTTASSCLLQAGFGALPPVPAGGFANVFGPQPSEFVCTNNLSITPSLNPAAIAFEALPADFADVDNDGNVIEALPMDRERQRRIPLNGVLQMGAYAAHYGTLLVP